MIELEVLEENPGKATYAALLRQCGRLRALWAGKRVHSHMITKGWDRDKVLGDCLVHMYGKCRSLGDARDAFERLGQQKDVYSWSIIIAAFAQNGNLETALDLYERMQREGVKPDMFVYSSVLAASCALGDLEGGQRIHARIVARGLHPDVVVQNSLVSLYARCGSIDDARRLFDGMDEKSLASWNAMVAGYARLDMHDEAFTLFRHIQLQGLQPDVLTYVTLLSSCSSPSCVAAGRMLHARVRALGLERNLVLATALLNMYAKCGRVGDAKSVFDSMEDRNQVSWNAMIAALVEFGHLDEAMSVYQRMQLHGLQPNAFTSASVLGACVDIQQGRDIHSQALACGLEGDGVVRTALLNMYARLGRVEEARKIFDETPHKDKDAVAWNAMVMAYTQAWQPEQALQLLDEMQTRSVRQDSGTFIAAAGACSVLGNLQVARAVHARARSAGCESGIVLHNSILHMYARCGSLDDAKACFDCMPRRSVVSWNVLMNAYVEQRQGEQSLTLLHRMDCEGVHPNAFTFSCVAAGCTLLKALREGRAAHSRIVASGFHWDAVVVTAVIDMYGSCGSVAVARRTFDEMRCPRCAVAWNTMIGLYSQHGQPAAALELFRDMSLAGEAPNQITLTLVLHACTHAGMLLDALHTLACAVEHGISCNREHYACVVDALGRAGKLELAEDVMQGMPVEPHVGTWKCLLGACAVHGDADRGSGAAARVLAGQPSNAAPYVLLSNITKALSSKP